MNVFDRAINEHAPFDNNIRNALLRFCRCCRGIQKTKHIRRKNSSADARLLLKNFDLLCDCISSGVENEIE